MKSNSRGWHKNCNIWIIRGITKQVFIFNYFFFLPHDNHVIFCSLSGSLLQGKIFVILVGSKSFKVFLKALRAGMFYVNICTIIFKNFHSLFWRFDLALEASRYVPGSCKSVGRIFWYYNITVHCYSTQEQIQCKSHIGWSHGPLDFFVNNLIWAWEVP